MKKKLLGYVLCSCIIAEGIFFSAGYADTKIQAKIDVNKEFNQLQKTKTDNIEASIHASKKLNATPQESRVGFNPP
ncbi:MAG: hypothetical protein WC197_03635, partial [Candidatus Gastranaerophilaceae bacterium]